MTVSVIKQARYSCREHPRCKQLLQQSVCNSKPLFIKSIHGTVRLLHGINTGGQSSSLLRNHKRLSICLNRQQHRKLMLLRILRAASKVRYIFLGAAGTAGVGAKLVSLTEQFRKECSLLSKRTRFIHLV